LGIDKFAELESRTVDEHSADIQVSKIPTNHMLLLFDSCDERVFAEKAYEFVEGEGAFSFKGIL
jgi:hypothetical protein